MKGIKQSLGSATHPPVGQGLAGVVDELLHARVEVHVRREQEAKGPTDLHAPGTMVYPTMADFGILLLRALPPSLRVSLHPGPAIPATTKKRWHVML